MSNAIVIGFASNGSLMRVRNRLGTDLTSDEPITSAELTAIRNALQATATVVEVGVLNPIDYDATGDGETDDAPSVEDTITAAQAGSSKRILFTPGTYKTTSITIPTGVSFQFVPGASLSIPAGQTVTFAGGLDAGYHRIFAGAGTVAIGAEVGRVLPQWWGIDPILEITAELEAGENTFATTWWPDEGAISWEDTPIVRATLIDAANVEGNMLHWWVTAEEGVFTLHVQMLAPVSLSAPMKFLLEVVGFE